MGYPFACTAFACSRGVYEVRLGRALADRPCLLAGFQVPPSVPGVQDRM